MIRSLRVRGYKSLLDAELHLGRLTVLAGPNAAGKSNVADCLFLLSQLVTAESLDDAFEGHRGSKLEAFSSMRGFGEQVRAKMNKNGRLTMRIEVDVELQTQIVDELNELLKQRERIENRQVPYTRVKERLLRYSVEIQVDVKTGHAIVLDEKLLALKKDLTPKKGRSPFLEAKTIGSAKRLVARIERQAHPRYFELPRHRTLLSELSDPVYHPHSVAVRRELSSIRTYYVEPSLMREEQAVGFADDPGQRGEKLAQFYHTLKTKNSKAFANLNRNLRSLAPTIEKIDVHPTDRGTLELELTMEGQAVFPARLMSEGTLRLLCIVGMGVAPRPPSIVIYEEPENGVNAARLEVLTEIIQSASRRAPAGSQFILTTHSARVLDLLEGEALVLATTWDDSGGSKYKAVSLDKYDLFYDQYIRSATGDGKKDGFEASLGERVIRGDYE